MHYTAIANNGRLHLKEHLDDFNELQEFMNKMEKRGFLNVSIKAFNSDGINKEAHYSFNGTDWENAYPKNAEKKISNKGRSF